MNTPVRLNTHALRLFSLVCILIVSVFPGSSGSAALGVTVSGYLIDAVTQAGIPSYTVYLFTNTFGGLPVFTTTTNAAGYFQFDNIEPGRYVPVAYPPAGYIGQGSFINVETSNVSVLLTFLKNLNLYSPENHAIVEVPNPVLCWEGLPQAVSYRVQINRKSDGSLIANPATASTCYPITASLDDNLTYSWSLTQVRNVNGINIAASGSYEFTYRKIPVTQTINLADITTLASWDSSITFTFPAGVFSAPGVLTYQRLNAALPGGKFFGINKTFDISTSAPLAPGSTYTVSIKYTDFDARMVNPDTLALYYWDSGLGRWVKEPTTTVDEANHTISASPDHFSKWSVFGETNTIFLPSVVR